MIDHKLDFPLLARMYQNNNLVYFDNAATTPKPQAVINSINNYYYLHNANIHRGPNFLSEEATSLYEKSRQVIADFIKADKDEIIFTSGTTAGINLIARSWGEKNLRAGDIVALTKAEHHANIIPWLQLKEKIGIELIYIELNDDASFNQTSIDNILSNPRLRVLSITQASNVLGRYYDLTTLIKRAKELNVLTVIDAAQSVTHRPLNVKNLDCDFLVFSGHKLFAPSGVGVIYGRKKLLEEMPPFFGGGNMISQVSLDSFVCAAVPAKFEAGTPNIEGAIGLGEACRYLQEIGFPEIVRREDILITHFFRKLSEANYAKLLGGFEAKIPVFALALSGIHPHDAADLLGEQGIITRAGHHCAQPLHDYLHIPASLRVSLSFYNTVEEIDIFFNTLKEIHSSFQF